MKRNMAWDKYGDLTEILRDVAVDVDRLIESIEEIWKLAEGVGSDGCGQKRDAFDKICEICRSAIGCR